MIDNDISPELYRKIYESLELFGQGYKHVCEKLKAIITEQVEIEKEVAMFTEWDSNMSSFSGGDCVDLTKKLLQEWQSSGLIQELTKSGWEVLFAEGTEPKFFNSEEDNHAFILVIKDKNKIIVDPSLQLVGNCKLLQYKTRHSEPVLNILDFDRGNQRKIKITYVQKENDLFDLVNLGDIEAAVIGITDSGSFAVFIGIIQTSKGIAPFVKLSRDEQRFYFIPDGKGNILSNIKLDSLNQVELDEVENIKEVLRGSSFRL
jgi:hypothetical protein